MAHTEPSDQTVDDFAFTPAVETSGTNPLTEVANHYWGEILSAEPATFDEADVARELEEMIFPEDRQDLSPIQLSMQRLLLRELIQASTVYRSLPLHGAQEDTLAAFGNDIVQASVAKATELGERLAENPYMRIYGAIERISNEELRTSTLLRFQTNYRQQYAQLSKVYRPDKEADADGLGEELKKAQERGVSPEAYFRMLFDEMDRASAVEVLQILGIATNTTPEQLYRMYDNMDDLPHDRRSESSTLRWKQNGVILAPPFKTSRLDQAQWHINHLPTTLGDGVTAHLFWRTDNTYDISLEVVGDDLVELVENGIE